MSEDKKRVVTAGSVRKSEVNAPRHDNDQEPNDGPGVGVPAYEGKNRVVNAQLTGNNKPSGSLDQDQNDGPGVGKPKYEGHNGVIETSLTGNNKPSGSLDQDQNDGPGVR